MESVFSPDDLAMHWGCSANTVRSLIRTGQLNGFIVGHRLFRFTESAVREYESCRKSASGGSTAATSFTGGTKTGGVVRFRLEAKTRQEAKSEGLRVWESYRVLKGS